METSSRRIGSLNFLVSFLISIPVLGSGIWLSVRANTTDCMQFLQWPIITIGVSIMLVSLAGFVSAHYRINNFLMYICLWSMVFLMVALLVFVIITFTVTDNGSGRPVMNRVYLDYSLEDYSGSWLTDRVASDGYWSEISACIRKSHVCRELRWTPMGNIPEAAQLFYLRKLSPIQSGCCKPPTSCGYTYVNETFWIPGAGLTGGTDQDCLTWSNEQEQLCYNCGSCKAGVVASLKKGWRNVCTINLVILIIMVVLQVITWAALNHNKKRDNTKAYGEVRIEVLPPF
ncbi:hypothetical protein OROHE_014076 [Orobanche hederae]